MFCSSCGFQNPDTFKFCSSCGSRASSTTESASPPPATPQDATADFSREDLESRYGDSIAHSPSSSGSGAGWKIAIAVGLAVLVVLLLVAFIRPAQTGVTLDSSVVEQLIVDDAASGGYGIYVECPNVMVGEPGDTWICEGGDQWGFSGPVQVTLEDNDGWVTWEYLF